MIQVGLLLLSIFSSLTTSKSVYLFEGYWPILDEKNIYKYFGRLSCSIGIPQSRLWMDAEIFFR